MSSSLRGQVAIVTGGSRGIGKSIACSLGLAGAAVVIASRKEESLRSAVRELRDAGVTEASYCVANAGSPEDAATCVGVACERYGPVTILVNNAGTNPYHGPLMALDAARADKTARVNIFGVIAWTQAAFSGGLSQRGGVVINIASVGGVAVDPSIGYYNATKAAVIHLTRQLAAELAPDIRVNAIAPGLVKTDMARALWVEHERELARMTPLGRLGEPQDIGPVAVFLASEDSSWITGQTIYIDGGQLVRSV